MNMNESLFDAAWEGDTDTVKKLLGAGAGLNARNNSGTTALPLALKNGHTATASVLRAAARGGYAGASELLAPHCPLSAGG